MNWSLLNPWMMAWGLAALIPLVLYFLRRRSRQRVEWGAMQFLHAALRGPVSRHRQRRWWLLVTRMLIPLLVALVAASPGCLDQGSDLRMPDRVVHRVLVFDISASMGPRHDRSSALQVSIDNALPVIDQANAGDLFTVITSGAEPARPLVVATADRQRVRREVLRLETDGGRFQVDAALGLASEIAIQPTGTFSTTSLLFIFSDFAVSDWSTPDRPETRVTAEFSEIRLLPARPGQPANLAVTGLSANPASTTVGQPLECLIELTPFGLAAEQTVEVEWFVDGELRGSSREAIQPDQVSRSRFAIRSGRTGDLEIEVRISGPGLLLDHRRYLVVPSRSQIEVLCLEGEQGAADSFVAATAGDDRLDLPRISPVVVDVSQLTEVNLQSFDVLVLLAVDRLTAAAQRKLVSFVRQGGRLLGSPGSAMVAESWQSLLNEIKPGSGITVSGETRQGDFRLDPLNYEHPVLAKFQNHPQAGILDAPVQRFYQVGIEGELISRVLDFDTGDPALFGLDAGQGKIAMATTPLTPLSGDSPVQWNQLAAWWSYVPLINETVFWLYGGSTARPALQVGDRLTLDVRPFGFVDQVNVELPGGSPERYEVRPGSEEVEKVVETPTLRFPGFVRVQSPLNRDAPAETRLIQGFAVNVPGAESASQPMDLAAVRNQFQQPATGASTPPNETLRRSRLLYLAILILILIALILETVLANSPPSFAAGRHS